MADMERANLVGRAVSGWIDQFTDLGGRNNLLYYKDLRYGTLDLAAASDSSCKRLIDGRKVRCSQIFPDPVLQANAVSRLKGIHRKMKRLSEELGIHAGYVAAGMASWRDDRKSPAALIILRELSITPTTPARDDFELVLDEESVINPVLHDVAMRHHAETSPCGLSPKDRKWNVVIATINDLSRVDGER
jgi:Protein of unknown function (DUF4011)